MGNGESLSFVKKTETNSRKNKKTVKFRDEKLSNRTNKLIFDDDEDSELDDMHEEQKLDQGEAMENGGDETEVGVNKRPINYEIEKNRGLTPRRPKEYRNPRVRNRMKARKALIKHKSIVPKVRSQDKRYSGEGTGIRTGVVRAVKIK